MPPRTVTCYICGRDFGSRSIGIHLPNCQKKWEAEQEKLPKKEKRPLPTAPDNFDKVVSGEIKGKELVKINQKAFEEHNEFALESCQFCERTFLPTAIASHRKACTEENPMLKQKGPGYTSQMKAKVKYPKLKSKNEKKTENATVYKESKSEVPSSRPEPNAINDNNPNPPLLQNPSVIAETAQSCTRIINMAIESPVILRKETVTLRHSTSPVSITPSSNRSSIVEETIPLSSDEAMDEESPLKKIKPKSSLTRGPGTFRKRSTFVKDMNCKTIPSKDDVIAYVENETIFDCQDHRREILELVTNYAKDVRMKQVLTLLEHKVFKDSTCLGEAVELLQDYVKNKTNNNF